MSPEGPEALWARLAARGLVQGERPARADARSPWYVRIMLGIAGWIGALFLFGFVGVLFEFVMQEAIFAIALGGLVCGGAAFFFRADPKGDFTAQFGLAGSLAGQCLILYGLAQWLEWKIWPVALAMAVVQAVLFVVVPNFIHRVWVASTGILAAAFALVDLRLDWIAPALVTASFAWVWIREFDFAAEGAALRAGGYGLALATLPIAVLHDALGWQWLYREGGGPIGGEIGVFIGSALSAAVLPWAVVLLLRREGVVLSDGLARIALAGAAILALVSFKAPGVAPAATMLVIGFSNGNRVLAGLGILAMLGYLSHYYYSLGVTLMEKSALLASTGLALLLARALLRRGWPAAPAENGGGA